MGGNPFRFPVIGRVLHRGEIINLPACRYHHHSSGMLTCRTFYPAAPFYQPVNFRIFEIKTSFVHITTDKTESGLFGQGAYSSGAKNPVFSKEFLCISMYLRLVFSGKIKINIRFLVPFKTHKSGKRNVVAVLLQSSPALRAIFRGKVDSGQLATGLRKLAVPAVRTKI